MKSVKKMVGIAACLGIVLCLTAMEAVAQNCQDFLFLQKNKTVEMTFYNKKGEENGKQVYQVSDVTVVGGTTTASLASEIFDKKGKSTAKANSSIQCTGGTINMDMKMMIPQQQAGQYNMDVKAQSFYLEYPSALHAGDVLKDGNLSIEFSNHPGMTQTLTLVIRDRKVLAQESVTTAAGTWNCFKIGYHMKVGVKTGFMNIPYNTDGTEWYAPGFGIVKTENKYGGTAITSIK